MVSGCIFNDINHLYDNKKQIWLVEGLKLLSKDNIKFCNHDLLNDHVTQGGYMTIDEMINNHIFLRSVKSLQSVNIMYVSQLINEGNTMKTWKSITRAAGRSNKGHIPNWFKILEAKMIKDFSSRKVVKSLN
jgi:hypothetical protein